MRGKNIVRKLPTILPKNLIKKEKKRKKKREKRKRDGEGNLVRWSGRKKTQQNYLYIVEATSDNYNLLRIIN